MNTLQDNVATVSTKLKTPVLKSFNAEYKFFLENYLFRFLGVLGTKTSNCKDQYFIKNNIEIYGQKIIFSAGGMPFYEISTTELPIEETDDNISLVENILTAFFSCSEFFVKPTKESSNKQNNYRTYIAREKAYNLAIQDGLSQWIFGKTDAETRAAFFDLLEKWSVKTYEGRHVTLGFLIDPSENADYKKPILSFKELLAFLSDDSSAVLSDCIHSVMMLDKDCNLIGYNSVTDDLNTIPECILSDYIPIRFIQTVQKCMPFKEKESGSDRIGVFLLSNGDILLVKNGTTRFVKRNLQWLNLSKSAFVHSLEYAEGLAQVFEGEGIISSVKPLLDCTYASVLDVSFSHMGGIIAVLNPSCIGNLMKEQILCPYDNLRITDKTAKEFSKKYGFSSKQPEAKTVRRKLLRELTKRKSFCKMDRKLRSELMSLDGACIIDYTGKIYAFGAIIQNDSGSATGGRSSAAKKLSRYGIAIKISTDGYIDVYINEKLVYSIK